MSLFPPKMNMEENKTFSVFLPFAKTEDQPDGTLMVWGRATQEVVDSENEICDFESSAPLFQRRSQMMKDASGGENLFPLRAMHQPIAAGRVVEMSYLPDEKAIDICAKVVDSNEAKKVREHVYTGFSVAGKYARRWRDPGTNYVRFTADPREISLVDVPAVPSARLTLFKLEGEELSDIPPMWVSEYIAAVNKQEEIYKAEKADKEAQESKLKALGERIGISRRNGSPITAPKDYPDDPNEYGDPANWAYPVDSKRVSVAVGRFNGDLGAEQYSPRSRHVLGRRIARLASRFGTKYKYDPGSKKIVTEKEGKPMTDTITKLDLPGVLAQLKAARDTAADIISKDPEAAKDAMSALMGHLDGVIEGSAINPANPKVPAHDPGHQMAAKVAATTTPDSETSETDESSTSTTTPPAKPAKPAEKAEFPPKKKVEESTTSTGAASSSTPDVSAAPAKKVDDADSVKAILADQAQKIEAQAKQIEKANDALSKATTLLEKYNKADSPIGDLAALVGGKSNSALRDPIVEALMEGGPYAMIKALKAAGGDDEIAGGLAFANVNNAIRRATYESLEAGGVVTSARYANRIFTPPS